MTALKYIRLQKEMTAIELAKELGITRGRISQLESGTYRIGKKKAKEISEYFNVKEEYVTITDITEIDEINIKIELIKNNEDKNNEDNQYKLAYYQILKKVIETILLDKSYKNINILSKFCDIFKKYNSFNNLMIKDFLLALQEMNIPVDITC